MVHCRCIEIRELKNYIQYAQEEKGEQIGFSMNGINIGRPVIKLLIGSE